MRPVALKELKESTRCNRSTSYPTPQLSTSHVKRLHMHTHEVMQEAACHAISLGSTWIRSGSLLFWYANTHLLEVSEYMEAFILKADSYWATAGSDFQKLLWVHQTRQVGSCSNQSQWRVVGDLSSCEPFKQESTCQRYMIFEHVSFFSVTCFSSHLFFKEIKACK